MVGAVTLHAEDAATKEECLKIDYQSPPCRDIEKRILADLVQTCEANRQSSLEQVRAQMERFREYTTDPLLRPVFKSSLANHLEGCLRSAEARNRFR